MKSQKENKTVQKVSVKPLMGYVLVLPSEAQAKTASGIILPESAQEKPAQGKVVAVSDEIVLDNGRVLKAPVKIGETVLYKKWGGEEIKVEGIEYKLVKYEDLIAILEG